ncbi:MAG: hypothetical protein WDZ62_01735 [Candidatus Pacearchaeota archaeon]
MSKLEKELDNLEDIKYNLSDCFIPFKSFRHIPKILSEKDPIIKYTELFGNLTLPLAHMAFYYSLYAV